MCKKDKSLEELCDGDITVVFKVVIWRVIYGGVCLGDSGCYDLMVIDDSMVTLNTLYTGLIRSNIVGSQIFVLLALAIVIEAW